MNQQPENQEPLAPQPAENQPVEQVPPVSSTEPIAQPVEPIVQPVAAPVSPAAPASTPAPVQPQPIDPGLNQQSFGPTPEPAAAPAPTFAPNPVVVSGKGKSPLKLIAWLVGGLVVVAGIALAVYFMFFYVSKADYQKAADAYNSLKTLTDDTSDTSSLASDSSKGADALDSKADEIMKKYNEIGSLRAVQKDSTVNKAYSDLKQTLTVDVAFVHAMAKFMRAMESCTSITTTASISECASKLKDVKTDSSAVNDYAQAMAQIFEGYASGQSSSTSGIYDAGKKFSDATKKLVDDNQTRSDALKNAINGKLK